MAGVRWGLLAIGVVSTGLALIRGSGRADRPARLQRPAAWSAAETATNSGWDGSTSTSQDATRSKRVPSAAVKM